MIDCQIATIDTIKAFSLVAFQVRHRYFIGWRFGLQYGTDCAVIKVKSVMSCICLIHDLKGLVPCAKSFRITGHSSSALQFCSVSIIQLAI